MLGGAERQLTRRPLGTAQLVSCLPEDRWARADGFEPDGRFTRGPGYSCQVTPCAKSDVDEDKVVSWSPVAISFF